MSATLPICREQLLGLHMAALWRSRLRASLTALASSRSSFRLHSSILFGNVHLVDHDVLCVCACAHTWLRIFLAFKQMYSDSTWRGPVIWASEPRMFLVSTCAGYSSPLHFVFLFSDLSITNSASCRNGVTGGPCQHSSEIDRQVRKLIVLRDTSTRAQRYSSYIASIPPPLYHPASLRGNPFSFIHLQIVFSLLLTLLESQGPRRISQAALEKFPQYWFTLETPAGSPSATQNCRGLLKQLQHVISFPSHKLQFYVLCLGNFMFCVWRIHVYHRLKGSSMALRVYSGPFRRQQTYCLALLS